MKTWFTCLPFFFTHLTPFHVFPFFLSTCFSIYGNNSVYCFLVDFFWKLVEFGSLFDFRYGYYEHSRLFWNLCLINFNYFWKKDTRKNLDVKKKWVTKNNPSPPPPPKYVIWNMTYFIPNHKSKHICL